MMAIYLAVIVVGCSGGVSESVAEFCNSIDQCTESIASAETPSEARSAVRDYDEALKSFADDTTELTDADREAIMESLTRYADQIVKLLRTEKLIKDSEAKDSDPVAKMKRIMLGKISEVLDTSRTLGDFVIASVE